MTAGDVEAESKSMVSPDDEASGGNTVASDQERADDPAGTPGFESQDSEREE